MGEQTPPLTDERKGGLTFPCKFVIKVFGQASAEFETTVLTLIRKHQPDLKETAIQQRPGKEGKYLALSITVHAETREQLDAIYRDLTASPLVLMAL